MLLADALVDANVRHLLVAALLVLPLSGCLVSDEDEPLVACDGQLHRVRLYLGPGHTLVEQVPEQDRVVGNSFAGAFLTDDLDEWLSGSMPSLLLEGQLALTLFVEFTGSPAPIPQGDAANGYQFFNQFGSDRSLQPGYTTQNDGAVQAPGTQTRYSQTIPLPAGGFRLEEGDRVRLLLTSLALDSPNGSGHVILVGNPHASRIEFQARCVPQETWTLLDDRVHDVSLPFNQGLFTGQVPPSEANTVTVPLVLRNETQRLTIDLRQLGDANPVKDDIDVELVDLRGDALWSIGSPYSNEHGVLWQGNLDWLRQQNVTGVRVNSYSGLLYQGELTIRQEVAR